MCQNNVSRGVSEEKFGLIAEHRTEEVKIIALHLLKILERFSAEILIEKGLAGFLGLKKGVDPDALGRDASTIIVIGGDGTLLRSVYRVPRAQMKKFLGIRISTSLGFLMSTDARRLELDIYRFLRGEYFTEKRMRLKVRFSLLKEEPKFLNEVLVKSTDPKKMIETEVIERKYGEVVFSGRSDAVIVSTVTGASAHSLSVSGVVLDPDLDVLAVVPIAPLNRLALPCILPADRELEVRVLTRDFMLIGDGFYTRVFKIPEEPSSKLIISKGDVIHLVRFRRVFYGNIKRRLTYY
ncbi:MAG: hypothetical protein DRJ51_01680 [Thermoprotei archaeon]|nr:MAG: hypothetical protein DRJ36_03115 [Thermoprotei archaeon]RLE82339.1 MAG: hypothetical protein DRJ51_01680 [Thermoprotei archaeon]RLF03276.1 MAG: hypothetical protein DRJ59_01095 [Thermoprotei archaeon]